MRRLVSVLLALAMLLGTAFSEGGLSAYDIAMQMAKAIGEMQEIKAAPLQDTPERAIWIDARTDAKCALIVFSDADSADTAVVKRGTPDTTVRALGCCLLEIDSDLSAVNIDGYHQALADVLGEELTRQEPDYILNVNTKKFHYPSCSSVDEIKESNKQSYSGEKEGLMEAGYIPCKKCKP